MRIIFLLLGLAIVFCGGDALGAVNPWSYTPANVAISGGSISGTAINNVYTPQMFSATAGSGGDDSVAINAAIAAAAATPGPNGGEVFLPYPVSGNYNVCASGLTTSGKRVTLYLHGPAGGGAPIRVLPGCGTPPASVLTIPASTPLNSGSKITLANLTLDGYCLAAHDMDVQNGIGLSARNSVFRNAATGGSNILLEAGYEDDISGTNRVENFNDFGHECYSSAAALPNYNVEITGASDSYFDDLIGVNAYIANFISESGDTHFIGTHGYGVAADPYYGINLRPQWTFIIQGGGEMQSWASDNPLMGGVWLRGWNLSTLHGRAIVMGGHVNGSTATIGVQIDPGIQDDQVVNNDFSSIGNPANGVVQLGAADPSTLVTNNDDASYQAGVNLQNSNLNATVVNLVAAGTNQATATALMASQDSVLAGSGGVVLTANASLPYFVTNQLSSTLNLYPSASSAFYGLAANSPLAMPRGSTEYCWQSGAIWYCTQIQNAGGVAITGGSIDGAAIGGNAAASGKFTSLSSNFLTSSGGTAPTASAGTVDISSYGSTDNHFAVTGLSSVSSLTITFNHTWPYKPYCTGNAAGLTPVVATATTTSAQFSIAAMSGTFQGGCQ